MRKIYKGYIRQGHWEGDVYVIDEFELNEVILDNKAYEKWKRGIFDGKKALYTRATQDAIMAYSKHMTLEEYLKREEAKGGGDNGTGMDGTQSGGDSTGPVVAGGAGDVNA